MLLGHLEPWRKFWEGECVCLELEMRYVEEQEVRYVEVQEMRYVEEQERRRGEERRSCQAVADSHGGR